MSKKNAPSSEPFRLHLDVSVQCGHHTVRVHVPSHCTGTIIYSFLDVVSIDDKIIRYCECVKVTDNNQYNTPGCYTTDLGCTVLLQTDFAPNTVATIDTAYDRRIYKLINLAHISFICT
jgi:hypothetical protein